MTAEIFVVGIGPGRDECLTPQARAAIENADCLAGYPLYLDLLPDTLKAGKKLISSGMRHEAERCSLALDAALAGETTAIVCSGDPGIYALAGLTIELMEARSLLDRLNLTVVPGVPALCAAAALLGAPLMHDFACISLSDLLTPIETIRKRLRAALEADFVCVLYNPRSKGRPLYLAEAIEEARTRRAPNTPVGLVRKAFRPGQSVSVHNLGEFNPELADMLSIVIIGNTSSRLAGRYMLTPRGYAVGQGAT